MGSLPGRAVLMEPKRSDGIHPRAAAWTAFQRRFLLVVSSIVVIVGIELFVTGVFLSRALSTVAEETECTSGLSEVYTAMDECVAGSSTSSRAQLNGTATVSDLVAPYILSFLMLAWVSSAAGAAGVYAARRGKGLSAVAMGFGVMALLFGAIAAAVFVMQRHMRSDTLCSGRQHGGIERTGECVAMLNEEIGAAMAGCALTSTVEVDDDGPGESSGPAVSAGGAGQLSLRPADFFCTALGVEHARTPSDCDCACLDRAARMCSAIPLFTTLFASCSAMALLALAAAGLGCVLCCRARRDPLRSRHGTPGSAGGGYDSPGSVDDESPHAERATVQLHTLHTPKGGDGTHPRAAAWTAFQRRFLLVVSSIVVIVGIELFITGVFLSRALSTVAEETECTSGLSEVYTAMDECVAGSSTSSRAQLNGTATVSDLVAPYILSFLMLAWVSSAAGAAGVYAARRGKGLSAVAVGFGVMALLYGAIAAAVFVMQRHMRSDTLCSGRQHGGIERTGECVAMLNEEIGAAMAGCALTSTVEVDDGGPGESSGPAVSAGGAGQLSLRPADFFCTALGVEHARTPSDCDCACLDRAARMCSAIPLFTTLFASCSAMALLALAAAGLGCVLCCRARRDPLRSRHGTPGSAGGNSSTDAEHAMMH